jgi:hypothetical protein
MPRQKIKVTEVIYGNIPPNDLVHEIFRISLHALQLGQPLCYTAIAQEKTNLERTTLRCEHRR